MHLVGQSGARLVWLTAPNYDPAAAEARDLDPVNAAFRAVAGRWADVELVDTDAAIDGADGAFAEYLPGPDGPVQVRKGDGLHFCPSGAARIATAVLLALQHWWSLAPLPGWDAGAWRQNERYVQPLYNAACT